MNDKIKTSGWVTLLRIVAYVEIAAGCLLSVLLGVCVMIGVENPGVMSVLLGVLVIVVGVLFSFIGAASIMVMLGVAEDVHVVRVITERKP